MLYSGLMRELASYGFLVIALNHNDQTCMLTLGKPVEKPKEDQTQPKIMGNSQGPIAVPPAKGKRTGKNKKETV